MPLINRRISRRRGEKGTAALEFALCTAFILFPVLFGTVITGLNIIWSIEVNEFCRDGAHLYASGADFSQSTAVNMLLSLASGINITSTGGNGVIIFSTVTYIDANACQANGYQPNTVHCPNMNQCVIVKRQVVGNSGLHQSSFGTPNASLMDSNGNVTTAGYFTDPSTRATGFYNVIPLTAGQYAYMAETFLNTQQLDWWNGLGTSWVDARFIF